METVLINAWGTNGANGAQGPQGFNGFVGVDGAQGPQGLQGQIGSNGARGFQGATGPTGGTQGTQGATGSSTGWEKIIFLDQDYEADNIVAPSFVKVVFPDIIPAGTYDMELGQCVTNNSQNSVGYDISAYFCDPITTDDNHLIDLNMGVNSYTTTFNRTNTDYLYKNYPFKSSGGGLRGYWYIQTTTITLHEDSKFKIQLAQGTAQSGLPITIKKGSYIKYRRIG